MFHNTVDRSYHTHNGLERPARSSCTITRCKPRPIRIVHIVATFTAKHFTIHPDWIYICWWTISDNANGLTWTHACLHARQWNGSCLSLSATPRTTNRLGSTTIDARALRAERFSNVDTRHFSNTSFRSSGSSTIGAEACISPKTQRSQLRCLQRTKSQVRRDRHVQLFRVLESQRQMSIHQGN